MSKRIGVSVKREDGKIKIINVAYGTKLEIEKLPPIPWVMFKISYYQRMLTNFIDDFLFILTHSNLLHVEYVDSYDLQNIYINELKLNPALKTNVIFWKKLGWVPW